MRIKGSIATGLLIGLAISLITVPHKASATSFVTLTITVDSDSAGNIPNSSSSARAYSRGGSGGNYSQKTTYINKSFVLLVPKDENLVLELVLDYGTVGKNSSQEYRFENIRNYVPRISFASKDDGLNFKTDTTINIPLPWAMEMLNINVTDSQLNLMKNVTVNENFLSAWGTEIKLRNLDWTMRQDQDHTYSTNGNFQFVYYKVPNMKLGFVYHEAGVISPDRSDRVKDRYGPNNSYTRVFNAGDFQDINLCFIYNLDSTKSTNPKCFDNVLKEKVAADLKAKQEAEAKAAADLKAKQEAEAKAAAKKKITITCLKGKLVKKVTGMKPVCPKGYKKK